MADSLGQVYQGQDGTGLAWKAPASTFDPVRGYPEYDAMKAKAIQDKAEKDNVQRKADLELLKYDPSKWQTGNTQYVAPYIGDVQEQITEMFTKSGGNLSIEDRVKVNALTNELKLNVATLNDQGTALEKVQAALAKPGADKAFDIDATNEQFAIYSNPYISSDPNVREQLKAYEEKIRNNPNYANLSDKAIQGRAALDWRVENGANYLVGQRMFDENNFIKELQGIRNLERAAYSKGVSEGKYTDVKIDKYTQDRADELITKNYETWLPFKKEMQKKFSELSPSQQKIEGSPLEYAKRRYRKDLVVNDVFETSRESGKGSSSQWGVSVPKDITITPIVNKETFQTIAGQTRKNARGEVVGTGEGRNEIMTHNGASFTRNVSGKDRGIETKVTGKYYWPSNDITNKKEQAGTADFEFIDGIKAPTLTEPIKIHKSTLAGLKEFIGRDVSALIKGADANGMVTIDAVGEPIFDNAVTILRDLGYGNKIKSTQYAYGNNVVKKPGALPGSFVEEKNDGVYYLMEDVEDNLNSYMDGTNVRAIVNKSTPDVNYGSGSSSSQKETSQNKKTEGKLGGETLEDYKKRTGKGFPDWNKS